jgi:nucleotide-binding universal stress UspA family protein
MNKTIKDIMIEPVLINNDATFIEVLQRMLKYRTNSLLVVNKRGVLVGRVQSLNLLWKIKPGYLDANLAALASHFIDEGAFRDACIKEKDTPLEEFMEKDPTMLKPESSLMEAALVAIEDRHARIPVVNAEKIPVGIVTRTELKRVMGFYLGIDEDNLDDALFPSLAIGSVEPLRTMLLPLAGNAIDERIVKFAGCLAAALAGYVKDVTLLHVTGEGFFKNAATRRVKGEIIKSNIFKSSRVRQINEVVKPMLDKTESDLRAYGLECNVRQKIVDGDYTKQILQVADEGCFSSIIMGRRGLSLVGEIFKGSVSAGVLHRPFHGSVYIVGEKFTEVGECPIKNILIPVDGSDYSLSAVREAATLASHYSSGNLSVTLVNVVDISKHSQLSEALKKETKQILDEGRRILVDAGVAEDAISTRSHHGRPAESILADSRELKADIIMIGRRGRSSIEELFMGSVSNAVLHGSEGETVAIISSRS